MPSELNDTFMANSSLSISEDNFTGHKIPVIVAGYAELVDSCIGVPANLLVLYLWYRIGRKENSQGNDVRIQNNNHWFILGITVADLVFTGIHSPMAAAWFVWYYFYPKPLCSFFFLFTHFSTTSSSMNVLLLNLDKFIYLYRPLRYYDLITRNRAIIALLISWSIGALWATIFTFGPLLEIHGTCPNVTLNHPSEYLCFALFFFILPITASFCICCYIATITIRAADSPRLPEVSCSASVSENTRLSVAKNVFSLTRLRRIAYIFTTTIWGFCTCLPYRIVYILQITGHVDKFDFLWTFYIFYIMMTVTAVGNPFITVFTQPHYKKEFFRIFLTRREFGSRSRDSSSYIGMQPSLSNNAQCNQPNSGDTTTYQIRRNSQKKVEHEQ